MIDELVEIGKVSGVFGIKGEIKLLHYSGERERLTGVGEFFLHSGGDEKPKPFSVQSLRYVGKIPAVKLREIDDRDAAESLRGCRVFVKKSDMTPLDEGSYYIRDLIGAEVRDIAGTFLGDVREVIDNPAHEILVVGESRIMIPFVDAFVASVEVRDGAKPRITVSLPEGLMEVRA